MKSALALTLIIILSSGLLEAGEKPFVFKEFHEAQLYVCPGQGRQIDRDPELRSYRGSSSLRVDGVSYYFFRGTGKHPPPGVFIDHDDHVFILDDSMTERLYVGVALPGTGDDGCIVTVSINPTVRVFNGKRYGNRKHNLNLKGWYLRQERFKHPDSMLFEERLVIYKDGKTVINKIQATYVHPSEKDKSYEKPAKPPIRPPHDVDGGFSTGSV